LSAQADWSVVSASAANRKITRLRPRRGGDGKRRAVREAKEWAAKAVLASSAFFSIIVTILIVSVLVVESWAFFRAVPLDKFLLTTDWSPLITPPRFGIWALVSATLVTTVIALVVALPIGTVAAVYLSEFAPVWLRETIKPTLELLSAVPTVVYGYFALAWVSPALQFFLPRLDGSNMLTAGLVMGIMIVPYVSSLSEDAMRSVPMLLREGSYALGGNKFTTAWKVVIPSALSGIGAAFILGISRAIGETMIVAVAAGNQPRFTLNPLQQAQTITAYIVATSGGDPQHDTIEYRSLFAAGLVLFGMTLVFNILGYLLRRRYHQAY
jgi:phosphate transport system permease protein